MSHFGHFGRRAAVSLLALQHTLKRQHADAYTAGDVQDFTQMKTSPGSAEVLQFLYRRPRSLKSLELLRLHDHVCRTRHRFTTYRDLLPQPAAIRLIHELLIAKLRRRKTVAGLHGVTLHRTLCHVSFLYI